MIYRKKYIEKLLSLVETPLIKTLVGVRRVGKSVIIQQFMEQVGIKTCIYINKEDNEFRKIVDAKTLEAYILQELDTQHKHIIIDEIQHVIDRESAILSIHTKYRAQLNIVITGSNSTLLSHEIGTKLRGRTIDISVYPFSFSDYREFFELEGNFNSFQKFLIQGGLPSSYTLPSDLAGERVQNLINTVFLKDVVERHHIRDIGIFSRLYDFIIDNVGNKTNINSLIKSFKSLGVKMQYNSVANYIEYMREALLIHAVPEYDIKGKKLFEKFAKLYSFDHNTKYILNSSYDIGYGKYLENYIYISLMRTGRNVYIGKYGNHEIDFIAEKVGKKIYIQVSYLIQTPEVKQREFGNLLLIPDQYPKYVISCDMGIGPDYQGVSHIYARDRETELDRIS